MSDEREVTILRARLKVLEDYQLTLKNAFTNARFDVQEAMIDLQKRCAADGHFQPEFRILADGTKLPFCRACAAPLHTDRPKVSVCEAPVETEVKPKLEISEFEAMILICSPRFRL